MVGLYMIEMLNDNFQGPSSLKLMKKANGKILDLIDSEKVLALNHSVR